MYGCVCMFFSPKTRGNRFLDRLCYLTTDLQSASVLVKGGPSLKPHSSSLLPDVNIWLVTFGFHLHNAIPGFPIPKFDLTQPSLEMKKSQLWDDLPVRNLCLT